MVMMRQMELTGLGILCIVLFIFGMVLWRICRNKNKQGKYKFHRYIFGILGICLFVEFALAVEPQIVKIRKNIKSEKYTTSEGEQERLPKIELQIWGKSNTYAFDWDERKYIYYDTQDISEQFVSGEGVPDKCITISKSAVCKYGKNPIGILYNYDTKYADAIKQPVYEVKNTKNYAILATKDDDNVYCWEKQYNNLSENYGSVAQYKWTIQKEGQEEKNQKTIDLSSVDKIYKAELQNVKGKYPSENLNLTGVSEDGVFEVCIYLYKIDDVWYASGLYYEKRDWDTGDVSHIYRVTDQLETVLEKINKEL